MKQPVFEGLATAIVTPFRNGTIDIPTFEKLLDAQLAANVDAIVVCGTTGRERNAVVFRAAHAHRPRNAIYRRTLQDHCGNRLERHGSRNRPEPCRVVYGGKRRPHCHALLQ